MEKIGPGEKIANLRPYLWRVVYTTALDILRERKITLSLDNIAKLEGNKGSQKREVLSIASPAQFNEKRLLVDKAIDNLPARKKSVLSLHFSGLSIKQIAAFLGWRESQVRHVLYGGLNNLKQILREQKG